eukprot:evm.model.NODE_17448_length_1099_cov_14.952684.1
MYNMQKSLHEKLVAAAIATATANVAFSAETENSETRKAKKELLDTEGKLSEAREE